MSFTFKFLLKSASPRLPFLRSQLKRNFSTTHSKWINIEDFPTERIRNFSVVAHIDHGKSTLSDRLLELTGTIKPGQNQQVLDKLEVERERGITVKANSSSMVYNHNGHDYLLNLIDTPGHVDFSYEVSRSLGACDGALLLVDATQGIQAQTLSVFDLASQRNLKIIPVINKIDLPAAEPENVIEQVALQFDLDMDLALPISAKSGLNVESVLHAIVEQIPPPPASNIPLRQQPLKALLFDSYFDKFRGAVSLIKLESGMVQKVLIGDVIVSHHSKSKYTVTEVGILNPDERTTTHLQHGQVGYLVCGMKESNEAHIGDTIYKQSMPVEALPGFQPVKPMVFAGVFPVDNKDFMRLEENVKRLTLNDPSVTVNRESSNALGQGCRVGFLGQLHLDVFRQRLEDEHDSEVIITAPTVPYKVIQNGKERIIRVPSEFPEPSELSNRKSSLFEPYVNAEIIVPDEYLGNVIELLSEHRGDQIAFNYLENSNPPRVHLKYHLPLAEIVTDFYSKLKSATSGYASFEYQQADYVASDLVKLNMVIHHRPVDALAMIVHRSKSMEVGKHWVKKLKDVIPKQQFEVAIQAAIGQKPIARETIKAMRMNVTEGLYGGHFDRKLKKLNQQKRGKAKLKMKAVGNIHLPQSAFYDLMKS
ncbi:GUF1 GTPase-like protein [Wallemia mellicola]|uniref:GUF1 GTPase-like protein n=1 Tax=Wallemia mellicola TaxID=1708541 RepID=A0AB38MQA1_9BASI|nr:GUF1 GTPase-like protein [Wallemia mellicola]TIC61867.1 GUF1 GTPase-like protein [Wallemia mellicola]